MENGTVIFPKIYPRFILCAGLDEHNTNLTKYEDITISHEPTKLTKKLQPFQPMMTATQLLLPLRGYRMCSRLEIDASTININWNNFNKSLYLMYSVHPEETHLEIENGMELNSSVVIVISQIKQIDIFEYYTGMASDFSTTYPSTISPYFNVYNQKHCEDGILLLKMSKNHNNSKCYTNYVRLFNELKNAKSPYRWWNISQYGCLWKDGLHTGSIKCGCTEKELLKISGKYQNWITTLKECKPSGLRIRYHPEILKIRHKKTEIQNHTKVRLYKDIVLTTTTQSPAMTVVDLLSQIGGFLGLLVGASVITLFEVFEYVATSCCQRIKSLVLTNKVTPVKVSV